MGILALVKMALPGTLIEPELWSVDLVLLVLRLRMDTFALSVLEMRHLQMDFAHALHHSHLQSLTALAEFPVLLVVLPVHKAFCTAQATLGAIPVQIVQVRVPTDFSQTFALSKVPSLHWA